MKKFLIAGTSLAAVAAAGSAGAVDVTLGGSINMGIDFGLGKNSGNPLVIGEAFTCPLTQHTPQMVAWRSVVVSQWARQPSSSSTPTPMAALSSLRA